MIKKNPCFSVLIFMLAVPLAGCAASQAKQQQAAHRASADAGQTVAPANGPDKGSTANGVMAADLAAIRATALDYIEGWYAADAERMERALHPHLAKRFVEVLPNGAIRLTDTSALELVQQVRNGGGSGTPVAGRRTNVRVLDVFQGVASVRVDAHGWIDYMHLAKFGDNWKIVNVLWAIRRPSP